MERDFFGPRGAKTRQRRRSPQKMESARAQWGGLRRGKTGVRLPEPLSQELGPRRWDLEGQEDLEPTVQHAVPVGRRIEAPLGGVPPPNVFGVRRFAIRKGILKN